LELRQNIFRNTTDEDVTESRTASTLKSKSDLNLKFNRGVYKCIQTSGFPPHYPNNLYQYVYISDVEVQVQ